VIKPPTAASFTRSRAESDGSSPGSRWDEAAFKMEIQDKPRPALIQNGTRYLILKFKRTGDNSSGDTDRTASGVLLPQYSSFSSGFMAAQYLGRWECLESAWSETTGRKVRDFTNARCLFLHQHKKHSNLTKPGCTAAIVSYMNKSYSIPSRLS